MTGEASGFRFEKYSGQEKEVSLPEEVEGKPLSTIGMKAFLSCKSVERLVLPDTLERVEDWGFAHMKNLQEIVLPAKEVAFGKKVFLGCENLQRVTLSGVQSGKLYEGIPCFLATAFRLFGEETMQSLQTTGLVDSEMMAEYPNDILQNLQMAGDCDGQWRWLFIYDKALEAHLRRRDDEGFVPAFIGWFDVEDVDDQKQGYIQRMRESKIQLVFQRLLYSKGLEESVETFLNQYLRENTPFLVEKLTEQYLHREYFHTDIHCYKIWKASGGLTGEYAGRLMAIVPEEEPEIKSYLLECQLEDTGGDSFFAGLDL